MQSKFIYLFIRYISPLSKQYILRLIKLGNRKFSLKNWTLDLVQNEFSQNELTAFRIMRLNPHDPDFLTMNENFSKTLQKVFLSGLI